MTHTNTFKNHTQDEMRVKLLIKQSGVNKDFNKIIELIAPIVESKSKITKREIDKMQKLIDENFGMYKQENGEFSLYSLSLYKSYSTWQLNIYARDRFITSKPDENGVCGSFYIPDYTRVIYLDDNNSPKDIRGYIQPEKYQPTAEAIINAWNEYDRLGEQIQELESKRSSLDFHYYFNKNY